MTPVRLRLTALGFVLAGLLFVLYPAIRPFSDESSLQGAAAFASNSWVIAHSFGIGGFVLLELGLFGLYLRLQATRAEQPAIVGLVLSWIGIGLTLPFYGAEVFGLHAIGLEALKQNSPALVSLASSVRGQPGIWFLLWGLALLAVGIVVLTIAIWRSGVMPRWTGVPLAAGFALYIPQFTAPQSLRVAHGLLVTVGCALVAWGLVGGSQRSG